MTLARPILCGDTHFISRRVTQRQFLLRPRPIVEQAFQYVIAVASEQHGIEVHALIVLSNHWHCLLTDPDGKLPAFLQYVHEYVAKILNCSMAGRSENLWSNEKTSDVTLAEEVDVLDKLGYLMANPVAGQLVAEGKDWPGLRRMWEPGKETVTVRRPAVFYRANGKMPMEKTLGLYRPPAFASLPDTAAFERLDRLVLDREDHERANISGAFMGVEMILRQRLTDTPDTYAKRFGISPRIGAKNRWARLEAIGRLKDWLAAYRTALKEWRLGNRDVEFPLGTYALRRFSGVRCVNVST